MIGHLRDEIENSRKTSFSDLFSDGKPAEISRDFLRALFYISPASARGNNNENMSSLKVKRYIKYLYKIKILYMPLSKMGMTKYILPLLKSTT